MQISCIHIHILQNDYITTWLQNALNFDVSKNISGQSLCGQDCVFNKLHKLEHKSSWNTRIFLWEGVFIDRIKHTLPLLKNQQDCFIRKMYYSRRDINCIGLTEIRIIDPMSIHEHHPMRFKTDLAKWIWDPNRDQFLNFSAS